MTAHDANKRANARKAVLISKAESDALLLALQSIDRTVLTTEENGHVNAVKEDLLSRWGGPGA